MSLSLLLNIPATLIRRSTSVEDLQVSTSSEDTYGTPVPVVASASEVDENYEEAVMCWLQQERRTEPAEAGELSDAYWTVFLPMGVTVDTSDAIDVEGYGRFEFVGDPWEAVQGSERMWHLECTVRRTGVEEIAS